VEEEGLVEEGEEVGLGGGGASPSVGSSLMVTVERLEGASVGAVVVVVTSSSAGSSMVVLGMVEGASVEVAAR
jgi:hypothetical protein